MRAMRPQGNQRPGLVAEEDGNRTRLRLRAPTDFDGMSDARTAFGPVTCVFAFGPPSQNVQRLVRPIWLDLMRRFDGTLGRRTAKRGRFGAGAEHEHDPAGAHGDRFIPPVTFDGVNRVS